MKGQIHLYTGNGKGKTTAAFGLAVRAVGAGKKVFIGQFVKGKPYSELEAVKRHLPDITVRQYGLGCFIVKKPTEEDIEAARKGLQDIEKILRENAFDLVVLDELTIALHYRLFSLANFISVLNKRDKSAEIVITGRYAPAGLIELADLVTEMKEVTHYFTKGIKARKGIEY